MPYWYPVRDGDVRAVGLFRKHYSCRDPHIDYCRYGFSGNGESMILMTNDCLALWCWRLVKTEGVYCSVFHRNSQSPYLASDLVKEADTLAYERWPTVSRHFTHIDPRVVHGDGKCFKAAGWKKLKRRTKKKRLIILENLPNSRQRRG